MDLTELKEEIKSKYNEINCMEDCDKCMDELGTCKLSLFNEMLKDIEKLETYKELLLSGNKYELKYVLVDKDGNEEVI